MNVSCNQSVDIQDKCLISGYLKEQELQLFRHKTNSYYHLHVVADVILLLYYDKTERVNNAFNRIPLDVPQNFDKLAAKLRCIIAEDVVTEEDYTDVIDSVLHKATTEPKNACKYAELCVSFLEQLPTLINKLDWLQTLKPPWTCERMFRKVMIMAGERIFSSKRQPILEKLSWNFAEKSVSPTYVNFDKERHDFEIRKSNFIGAIMIIGELFNKKLLHSNIITKGIIKSLLPPENTALTSVDIDAICVLLKVSGKCLDKDEKAHTALLKYIQAMKTLLERDRGFDFNTRCNVFEIEQMANNHWYCNNDKQ